MIKYFSKRKGEKLDTPPNEIHRLHCGGCSPRTWPPQSLYHPHSSLGPCHRQVTRGLTGPVRPWAPRREPASVAPLGHGGGKGGLRAGRGRGKMVEEQVCTPPHRQSSPLISIAQLLSGPAEGPVGTPEQLLKPRWDGSSMNYRGLFWHGFVLECLFSSGEIHLI